MATPDATVTVTGFEVLVEWLVVAPSCVRCRGTITATGQPGLPASPLEVVIPCVDDKGSVYELKARAGTSGVTVTPPPWADSPATTSEISVEPTLPVTATWIELRPPNGSPVRVDLQTPKALPSGRSEPAWSTPAEWFLDALLPDPSGAEPDATFGVGLNVTAARHVAGAVADALLAVGALPPTSALLAQYPPRQDRWHHEITGRYATRANRQFAAGRSPHHIAAVGAAVPLEHAVAVFDSVVIQGRDVWLQLYVFPDAVGEYWPGTLRPFHVDATDDVGHKHQTIGATHWWHADHESIGDLWLWRPLEPAARTLRLTVSTPWEAAWIEIPLPSN